MYTTCPEKAQFASLQIVLLRHRCPRGMHIPVPYFAWVYGIDE
jgi:hypothetical protein